MVPPYSFRVPRVRKYSGYSQALSLFAYTTITFYGQSSHTILLNLRVHITVQTPQILLSMVQPAPRSLATTSGISVDFFSSPYLDVSVQAVPLTHLCIQCAMTRLNSSRIAPFGNLRISAYLRLPVAYRSQLRPSSAPSAKAFSLRSLQFDLYDYHTFLLKNCSILPINKIKRHKNNIHHQFPA